MSVLLPARWTRRTTLLVLVMALAPRTAPARQGPGPREVPPLEELWSEADIATTDLFLGSGATEQLPAPQTTFRLLKSVADEGGRGWVVRDPQGREWSVRYGPEAQAEIVASRLVWALGYHQPPLSYLVYWSMSGGDRPGPQAPSRFRLERPEWKRTGGWSWSNSPFKDAPAHRGLLVLMRILNNTELRDRDTTIFTRKGEGHGPRRQFVALDLGASLGRIDAFEQQGFVSSVENGKVKFDDAGGRSSEAFQNLTPADVRWTCERLNVLSDQQWRDVFRAAHYDEATAARFIRKLKEKVQVGLKLQ
jgi:hypothetical protein